MHQSQHLLGDRCYGGIKGEDKGHDTTASGNGRQVVVAAVATTDQTVEAGESLMVTIYGQQEIVPLAERVWPVAPRLNLT